MSNWIIIAILGYIFFAFNSVADKILLKNAVKKPYVYVFLNGMLASVVIVLLPFGVEWLPARYLVLALVGGACFTAAQYFYFSALQKISISRIQPIQGGLVPLFTLVLSWIILQENLSGLQLVAVAFLTAGAVLISLKKTKGEWGVPEINYCIAAALLFALHFVISKIIYDQSNFVTGLFWTRWGMVLFALILLLVPGNRREIRRTGTDSTPSNRTLFYFSRIAGGVAGLFQNYAIAIGSVTIVKALQSVQFSFVLLFASIMSVYYPHVLQETLNRKILFQKISAIILVVVGLVILEMSI